VVAGDDVRMERRFTVEAKTFLFSTKVSKLRLEERRKGFVGLILVSHRKMFAQSVVVGCYGGRSHGSCSISLSTRGKMSSHPELKCGSHSLQALAKVKKCGSH
jgi:hypothetical protein